MGGDNLHRRPMEADLKMVLFREDRIAARLDEIARGITRDYRERYRNLPLIGVLRKEVV